MANLNRTTTLTDSCNRLDLYNLINGSSIQNLGSPDLGSGFPMVTAASSPPTFNENVWWFDQTRQLLKMPVAMVDASPASLYLSVGPDAWHFPGYNVCDYELKRGTLVRFSYEEGAGLYDCSPMEPLTTTVTGNRMVRVRPELRNVYGFLQEDTAPNTFGPVLTYGFGHARVEWNTVASAVGSHYNTRAFELMPSSGVSGYMQGTPPGAAPSLFDAVCAMGLAQPETLGVSVLCPIFCNLPMGKNQEEN